MKKQFEASFTHLDLSEFSEESSSIHNNANIHHGVTSASEAHLQQIEHQRLVKEQDNKDEKEFFELIRKKEMVKQQKQKKEDQSNSMLFSLEGAICSSHESDMYTREKLGKKKDKKKKGSKPTVVKKTKSAAKAAISMSMTRKK